MKQLMSILFILCGAAFVLAASEQNEIVIEMSGSTVRGQKTPSMWEQNAAQLLKKWRGKTREQVLYEMPVVSNRDVVLREKNTQYALVEYQNGRDFRKFLFKGQNPQTLLTVAATAADVLAVNKRYHINIGLTQVAFDKSYPNKITLQYADLPTNIVLYQVSYRDVNTPKAQENWFLFTNGQLSKTFYTLQQKDTFVKQLQEEKAARDKLNKERATAQQTPGQTSSKNASPRKALLSGGTAYDQAYMPRVTNPNPFLIQDNTTNAK